MSMIPVKTKLLCNGTSKPSDEMLARVAAAGGMAGLGYAYGEDPGGESGYTGSGGGTYIGTNTGGGSSGGSSWAGIQDLLKMGLSIAGLAYLNNNQAKIATYGPNGTVLYQTSQIPSQYFNPAVVGGAGGKIGVGGADANAGFQMSTTAVVMMGVAALAVVMMMSRR